MFSLHWRCSEGLYVLYPIKAFLSFWYILEFSYSLPTFQESTRIFEIFFTKLHVVSRRPKLHVV